VSLRDQTEADREPDVDALLDQFWEDFFHEELASWGIKEKNWPPLRTREAFNQWFDVELNASVYDLTPEEPLSQSDVDFEDLAAASGRCAECGLDGTR
jgi:hypothetical protein